ncbi:MAG TPA: hypothetical protein VKH46_02940 [Thermoanaerobaculia bacterium]|jgi:glutathione synthase/RimK-type ligase-like ATP-grasp enzyme|nr:hypothetical protein [Thermoanaerobaculia bacterium]
MLKRAALVTCRELPDLTEDDRPLVAELARFGIAASPEIWDDPSVSWTRFDLLVIRSTWDYHRRLADFGRWIAAREAEGSALWNPAPLLRWNAHKFYLAEVEAKGIPIVPTRFLRAGDTADLARIFEEEGWERAVVKPAVSAGADRTVVIGRGDADDFAPQLETRLASGDTLVQRYLPEIETAGEWSFVFIDGAFSHAVRKRPARGDFRVQEHLGGMVDPGPAPRALVADARRALGAVDFPWLYARVDAIESSGRLLVMELEMFEPSLFLSFAPDAGRRLAAAIARAAQEERAGRRETVAVREG